MFYEVYASFEMVESIERFSLAGNIVDQGDDGRPDEWLLLV